MKKLLSVALCCVLSFVILSQYDLFAATADTAKGSQAQITKIVADPKISAPADSSASKSTAKTTSTVATPANEAKPTLDDLLGVPKETPSKAAAPTVKSFSVASAAATGNSGGGGSALDGSLQNIGKTVSIDSRSGAAGAGVPLFIPQGRGGISPALGLGYSASAGNGPFGWDWSMEMGSVMRSTKEGVPTYNNAVDTFLASVGGKSYELVSLGSNNEYRSKYDDDRMRFFLNNGVCERSIRCYLFFRQSCWLYG